MQEFLRALIHKKIIFSVEGVLRGRKHTGGGGRCWKNTFHDRIFFHGRKRRLWDTGGRGLQKQKFHGEEIVFTGRGSFFLAARKHF